MRASCLICNYNYEAYVLEAVESALAQTRPFDQIIVVDDGSTDNSWALLEQNFAANRRVKLIKKGNGGQLSGFNTGYNHFNGDILFFLDSDDTFHPQYVEKAVQFYLDNPQCDFLVTGRRLFGRVNLNRRRFGSVDRDLGCSTVLTYRRHIFVGDNTSALSAKKVLLDRFMPLPFETDWKLEADVPLVWAASLAGGHKFYMSSPLVNYRTHDSNHFFMHRQPPERKQHFKHSAAHMMEWLNEHCGLDDSNTLDAAAEFDTVAKPSLRWLLRYLRLTRGLGLSKKELIQQYRCILQSFITNR